MKIHFIFPVLVSLCISASALTQFDTKFYMISTEKEPGAGPLDIRTWKVESNFASFLEFNQFVGLHFKHRLDGSTRYKALDERVIPMTNHLSVGLQTNKATQFYLGVTNDILGRADTISPVYFQSYKNTMKQKVLSSLNLRWQVDLKKFCFLADMNYYKLNYDLIHRTIDTLPGDTAFVYNYDIKKSRDDDMWTELDIGVKPTEGFKIGIGTMLKNDFNSSSSFDYGDHRLITLEGDHTIKMKRRKFFLYWRISEHYRISEQLYLNGDAEGFATKIYLRPVFQMKKRLYLKGVAKFDLSKEMLRQWYEFSLKKNSKNNSSLELGYWHVLGSYFPRSCAKFKSVLYLGEVVGFSPEFQYFWRVKRDNGDYKYYRWTGSLEMLFNIDRVDIYTGYGFTYYKDLGDVDPYTKRGAFYFGLRKW